MVQAGLELKTLPPGLLGARLKVYTSIPSSKSVFSGLRIKILSWIILSTKKNMKTSAQPYT